MFWIALFFLISYLALFDKILVVRLRFFLTDYQIGIFIHGSNMVIAMGIKGNCFVPGIEGE